MSMFSQLLHGGKNPANDAMQYINQIPGQTSPYLDPFFQAGKGALPGLQEQYGNMTNDPGGLMNHIGESYQQSPGLAFAIQQAMQGAGHAAAAGGMAGSPEHEQQNMELSGNLANQDYNDWMGNALGLYKGGMEGQQGMAGMGQQAGQSLSDTIAQTLAQQANLKFNGQQQQNKNQNDLFGNLFNLGGSALGAFGDWYKNKPKTPQSPTNGPI